MSNPSKNIIIALTMPESIPKHSTEKMILSSIHQNLKLIN